MDCLHEGSLLYQALLPSPVIFPGMFHHPCDDQTCYQIHQGQVGQNDKTQEVDCPNRIHLAGAVNPVGFPPLIQVISKIRPTNAFFVPEKKIRCKAPNLHR